MRLAAAYIGRRRTFKLGHAQTNTLMVPKSFYIKLYIIIFLNFISLNTNGVIKMLKNIRIELYIIYFFEFYKDFSNFLCIM